MPQTKIQLIYLPKQYDGRINAHTFRANCTAKHDCWLILPDNINLSDRQFIIKIQESDRRADREIYIMKLLKEHNISNTIPHIYSFSCKDDTLLQNDSLTELAHHMTTLLPNNNLRPFYSDQGITLFFMKYIDHNLRQELRKHILPEHIVKNILKQLVYLVLQLWYQFGIIHGDLNDGNIMLDIDSPKINTYTIGPHIRHINTLGYEPILIDFQWAIIYRDVNESYVIDDIVINEAFRCIELYRHYISNYMEIYNRCKTVKTLEELLNVFDTLL